MIYRMAVKYIQTVFFLPVLFSAVFFRLSLVSFMSTFSLFVFPPSSSASPLFCIHIHADRLSEQFPRLYFFTLKGCFGWWVRREAGHHLAGRRRVEISEYNLEDEFWTLVTDISCWGNCIVLKQYETIIQQGGRESEGGNTNTMLRNTFITVLTLVKSVWDKLHLQRLIVSFLVTVMIIKVFLTEHKNI